MNTFTTIILAIIIVLGPLIFVHELGHFLFAKLFGVRVLKFSLGFGPKLFGRVVGETEYVISALPLGGYVKMFGENPDEQDVDTSDRDVSYAHKSVGRRFLIVFAGPLFNLLFPVLLFFILFLAVGVPEPIETTRIGQVAAQSPAMEAGVQPGDIILSVDGRGTMQWIDVLDAIKMSEGRPIEMKLQRDGEKVTLTVTPTLSDAKNIFKETVEKRYMVGIMQDYQIEYVDSSPWGALQKACSQTWYYIWLIVMGFVKLIQQVVPVSEIGGPILIAKIAAEQMREGWINLTYFIALLSVNLGILNLLPIPVLDGGHLAFLSLEAIRRKPLTERAQIIAQQIGLALLGALMLFAFYNDISGMFK